MNLTESKQYTKKELWLKYRSKIIKDCCHLLDIELFDKQAEIVFDETPIIIIRAGRRASKSYSLALYVYALLFFGGLFERELQIIFVGPSYYDTRFIWRRLFFFLKYAPLDELFDCYKEVKTNWGSKSSYKWYLSFSNGTEINTGSADTPDTKGVRGDGYDFAGLEEYGLAAYPEELTDAIAPAITDEGNINEIWIIGTPSLGINEAFSNHFDEGQDGPDKLPDKRSYKLHKEDNPYRDKESPMDSLLSEDGRAREVWGDDIPRGGRLFPEFKYKAQVVEQIYNPELPYFIGVDFGRNKPVVEFIQPDGDDYRVFKEISCKDILVDNLVKEIELVVEVVCGGNQPTIIGSDKAGKAKSDLVSWTSFSVLKKAFPQATFTTHQQLVSKDNQTNLYRKLTMQNRIFIDPSCKKLATAFVKATPNTKGGVVNPGWLKREGIDDPLDALIYGLINHNPGLILGYFEPTPVLTEAQRRQKEREFFG
ncbi:hypothetical protein LCGC14_1786670 [marine sediment metagenome]|uniref:Terminase large subunit gp17-like C-terminal domain-containing protein n=1 Tax=marine sediment metagenome TaxID=412755 RepID=A0A0F9GTV9_9ZZZZ